MNTFNKEFCCELQDLVNAYRELGKLKRDTQQEYEAYNKETERCVIKLVDFKWNYCPRDSEGKR